MALNVCIKQQLVSRLRDKNITRGEYRVIASQLGFALALEVANLLEYRSYSLQTPLAQAQGIQLKNPVMLLPILRSGIALLEPFMRLYNGAAVGFVGLRRDEKTAIAHLYYENIPAYQEGCDVLVLDPMIATGGSGTAALTILKNSGIPENKMIFAAIISSEHGLKVIKEKFPQLRMVVAQVDEALNDKQFIVPGLGDFGDRYFGTE